MRMIWRYDDQKNTGERLTTYEESCDQVATMSG